MCHLETGTAEATLDIEALVGLATVEDGLVTADVLCDKVERLDDAQAELLALLVFVDGNILNVANNAKVVNAGYVRAAGRSQR